MSQQTIDPTQTRQAVLRRSRRDRVIAGVCGGIGHYLGIDPVVVRILTVILAIASGGGAVIAYIVALVVIPQERPGDVIRPYSTFQREKSRFFIGAGLLVAGVLWILAGAIPLLFNSHILGAALLMAVGVLIIASANGPKR